MLEPYVGHKHFEVPALIEKGTQHYRAGVPQGPALLDVQGAEHIKFDREGKGRYFPSKVAEKRARVKVQNVQVSRPKDQRIILHAIAHY